MIKDTTIKIAKDNDQKRQSFAFSFRRYERAMANGFYFEALWILYAMLENRMSALLCHLGFTKKENRQNVTGNQKAKWLVRTILQLPEGKTNYSFNKLSGKIRCVTMALKWAREDKTGLSKYEETVKNTLIHFAEDESFIEALEYLNDKWINMRNQLTHALLNKDLIAASEAAKALAEEGYHPIRVIDNAADYIKNRNIRRRFNIQ